MHKLKSVFRSSSKRTSQHTEGPGPHTEATSPRSSSNARQSTSLDERHSRQSLDSQTSGAQYTGRSRPISSIYDTPSISDTLGAKPLHPDHAQSQLSQVRNESIASNYKAYLPALSPVQDSKNDDYMSMGGDRRLIVGESQTRHEEDVADRNIDRYGQARELSTRTSQPPTPVFDVASQATSQKSSDRNPTGAINDETSSVATGKFSVGRQIVTKGGLVDSIRPHDETTAHKKNEWKKNNWPLRGAREVPPVGLGQRRSRASESDDDDFHSLSDGVDYSRHPPADGPLERSIPVDGQGDIKDEIRHLLDEVVDLTNTVDEDKEVTWASAVTHEVVKPHEHEIIQHKIYREIHNYEYHHRIQPVHDLEVLPPRHWIPNPSGEGLIEISADELPSRTGNNRRWKIVTEDIEIPAESQLLWRTEPQIIEHPTTITEEGFERKETTIIYPPTLRDLSDYEGLVQPVHFDHETGKRWLGEITTMHKLRQQSSQVADAELSMKELGDTLPDVPSESDVPELSNSPGLKRKPVSGPVPARLGDLSSPRPIAAVA
ncbi:hypothetical protein DE146DRAFT_15719 [Phaeosphaeria sp. MPI-PUGE-AT-0046c]|nr:hypothetical protein DE146DRAFT_15719 [Phaeosphaeria sp. MPI-PUGE-AT-0046c]